MSENRQHAEKEIDYEQLLSVRLVEIDHSKKIPWKLAVSENFTLYITGQDHAHLYESYGVDPDMTLQEGYFFSTSAGALRM